MTHRRVLVLMAGVTASVLVLTAGTQIYDSNFVSLWEATAILGGDHPYRDFFEWGAPLAAYLSTAAQLLTGYRLIGEFLLQWAFIVAGVVMAFQAGFRLNRSIGALLVVLPVVIVILARTPTYHYSKLFLFPAAILLTWRYIERPERKTIASLGVLTAVAFLFRHDYGVYVGFAAVLALVLAQASSRPRRWLTPVRDGAIVVVTTLIVLLPWAVIVQTSEGLPDYIRARAGKYEGTFGGSYRLLLTSNPLRELLPPPVPPPKATVVVFVWTSAVDASRQQQLEQQYGLRPLPGRDGLGRLRYQVSNVYDPRLLTLDAYINEADGFEWDYLRDLQSRLPSRADAVLWLEQMTLIVPICLLISGIVLWYRSRLSAGVAVDAPRMIAAGAFLALVDATLFREPSYFEVVAPITAALGARFLIGRSRTWKAVAVALLALTMYETVAWSRGTVIFKPVQLARAVPGTLRDLLASPPASASRVNPLYRYLRDCTAPGDRLLITGTTPFDVSYYAERAVAGGHLYWHSNWRADPASERESLALLERQSVPLAVSPHAAVIDDFAGYPRIKAYLATRYAAVDGMHGTLLVDRTRTPVRTYGPQRLPCFR